MYNPLQRGKAESVWVSLGTRALAPAGSLTYLIRFVSQFKGCFALRWSGANEALVRLCCETLSGDRHLCTAVRPPATWTPCSRSCPVPTTPRSSHRPTSRSGHNLPPQNLPHHPLLHHIPERLQALRCALFQSPHHFLRYFAPKWDTPSSIRWLCPCWSSEVELNKSHPLRWNWNQW